MKTVDWSKWRAFALTWLRKLLHIPTLGFHGVLILLAALLLKDHGGAFLWIGMIGIAAYVVYAVRSVGTGTYPPALAASYLAGSVIQGIAFQFWFSGFKGLGASFAMLFYCMALLASTVILLAVVLCGCALKKSGE